MRILYLTPAYSPGLGGGERYVRSLAATLAERGHELVVVTSAAVQEADFWQGTAGQQPAVEKDGQVTVHRLPLKPFPLGRAGLLAWRKGMVLLSGLPGDSAQLLRRMARLAPPIVGLEPYLEQLAPAFDLVHGFNISWEYPLLAGWRYAQRHKLPLIVTPFAHFGVGSGDRVARNNTMKHQRQILHRAAAVQALTTIEQQELIGLGIKAKRVKSVGSGLDPLPDLVDAPEVLKEYHLQGPLALFVGRQNYEKGAIQAAQAILALQDRPLTLVLVGDAAPDFDRFYNRLSPQEQQYVRPLGRVSEGVKHTLLNQATMFLLPSNTDSFGIVLLEAWAHGVPVIGARAGGIPGVIDDGRDGILVPFGHVTALTAAIHCLLTKPELSQAMGTLGRLKTVERFTWPKVADLVLADYQRLLSPAKPGEATHDSA